MMTLSVALATFIGLACSRISEAQCPHDSDEDRHPIFGDASVRADRQFNDDGESSDGVATHVSFADLDNDGDTDMVFAVAADLLDESYISYALNRGDGMFDAVVAIGVFNEAVATSVADFDGNGTTDIAVAAARQHEVLVYFNNGQAVFDTSVSLPVGLGPRSLRSGDLNQDGRPDLLVMNHGSNDVSVLLNKDGLSFAPEVRTPVDSPFSLKHLPGAAEPGPHMVLVDVDGDDDLDGIVPCRSFLRILLNDGSGNFSLGPHSPQIVGNGAFDIATGDLDADGDLDLAVVAGGPAATGVSVLINEGGGVFSDPIVYFAGIESCPDCFDIVSSISAGDIDGDNDLDLVVTDLNEEHLGVLRNIGDGTFLSDEIRDAPAWPWLVRLADVTGDERPDLVVLSALSSRGPVHVYFANDSGSWHSPLRSPPGFPGPGNGNPNSPLRVADFDADGNLDAFFPIAGAVAIRSGTGVGTFLDEGAVPLLPGPAFAIDAVAADLNNDELPDLILLDDEQDRIFVAWNEGEFAFNVVQVIDPQINSRSLAVLDFDGDNDLDIAIAGLELYDPADPTAERDFRLLVIENTGGLLSIIDELSFDSSIAPFTASLSVGDVDGDGDHDVVAISVVAGGFEPSEVHLFMNDNEGALVLQDRWESPHSSFEPILVDMDGDGDVDLIYRLATASGEYLRVYSNDGFGEFSRLVSMEDKEFPGRGMDVADIDGDDDIDVAINSALPGVRVHLNNGDGTLAPGGDYANLDGPEGLAFGDFDHDNRQDLLILTDWVPALWFKQNVGCHSCPADINGDHRLNILDFVTFQLLWQDMDDRADCDLNFELNILDFVCFQQLFLAGCS